MKKILLASGCSNTTEILISDYHPDLVTNWPKWPELLAKKLDMDYINLGHSGAGNEFIYRTLLNYISTNDISNIGLVVPAWSQCQRKDYQTSKFSNWTNERIDPHGDIFSWMRRSLDNMLSFQIMCERYNLPYIQVAMLDLYKDWLHGLRPTGFQIAAGKYPANYTHKYPGTNKEKDNETIVRIINEYEKVINHKKFLGWPLSPELGGFSLQKKLISMNLGTIISNLDNHPNKKGQEVIAEYIHDWMG